MNFKEYRKIKKMQKEELHNMAQRVPYDEEDNILLQLKQSEIRKSFSIDGEDDSASLSNDFKQYLLTFRDSFAVESICVNLDVKTSESDKKKFETLYKSFFKYRVIGLAKDLKRNLVNFFWCISFGILAIIVTMLIQIFLKDQGWQVAYIIFEILAWVFVWESFDLLFFQRTKMKKEQLRNYHMYVAKFVSKPINVNIKEIGYKENNLLNK